eukprot:TRINITY_DN22267_c0_g1_i2.p1 TRINITY_DN22267_c0_g1~~TRINITY_DN22267_c0_g1_i2.p1  ORF type:complete len:112 (-),score=15.66 TRINITY_DN22267_c0_g1_i2:230-565(-)
MKPMLESYNFWDLFFSLVYRKSDYTCKIPIFHPLQYLSRSRIQPPLVKTLQAEEEEAPSPHMSHSGKVIDYCPQPPASSHKSGFSITALAFTHMLLNGSRLKCFVGLLPIK